MVGELEMSAAATDKKLARSYQPCINPIPLENVGDVGYALLGPCILNGSLFSKSGQCNKFWLRGFGREAMDCSGVQEEQWKSY